jgi:hypothetical protein
MERTHFQVSPVAAASGLVRSSGSAVERPELLSRRAGVISVTLTARDTAEPQWRYKHSIGIRIAQPHPVRDVVAADDPKPNGVAGRGTQIDRKANRRLFNRIDSEVSNAASHPTRTLTSVTLSDGACGTGRRQKGDESHHTCL